VTLDDRQVAFFRTFGFLVLPGLMRAEIASVTDAFSEVWSRAERAATPGVRDCLVPFIDRSPRLAALLDDPRVCSIPERLLGSGYNYCSSDGNLYAGDTPYHSNPFPGELNALKVAFYLDPVDATSGCLRVFPGSHRFGEGFAQALTDGVSSCVETWGVEQAGLPAVPLPSEPGDVIVFAHSIKHGSFGGREGRRLFVMNFAEHCPEERLPDLRRHVGSMARFWNDSYYGEHVLADAPPARVAHLQQILDNQDHLPGLVAECRSTMPEPARH
jgi:phytanoyl-CoA dioxygenase PhyH